MSTTNNYLFENLDFSLLESTINKIISNNKWTDYQKNTYDLEIDLLEKVLEDIDTYSFLSPNKVIIVKNCLFLENSNKITFVDKDVKHLAKYLDNPRDDVILILIVKKLDERKKIVKEIKKKVEIISEKANLNQIIEEKLDDYQMSFKTRSLLLDYTNEDPCSLVNECEKLRLYKIEEKTITEDDVKNLVFRKKKNVDNKVFALINSIAMRDKKKIISSYLELLEYSYEEIAIIALLESQLRLIYQIKIAHNAKISNKDLAVSLNVHPYRIEKTSEFTSYYTTEDLTLLIKSLADLDYKIKIGKLDAKLGFKMFLLNI